MYNKNRFHLFLVTFIDVATRQCEVKYLAHIMFLLDSTDLHQRDI